MRTRQRVLAGRFPSMVKKFAEERTYRFLAAAFSDAESDDPVAERR